MANPNPTGPPVDQPSTPPPPGGPVEADQAPAPAAPKPLPPTHQVLIDTVVFAAEAAIGDAVETALTTAIERLSAQVGQHIVDDGAETTEAVVAAVLDQQAKQQDAPPDIRGRILSTAKPRLKMLANSTEAFLDDNIGDLVEQVIEFAVKPQLQGAADDVAKRAAADDLHGYHRPVQVDGLDDQPRHITARWGGSEGRYWLIVEKVGGRPTVDGPYQDLGAARRAAGQEGWVMTN